MLITQVLKALLSTPPKVYRLLLCSPRECSPPPPTNTHTHAHQNTRTHCGAFASLESSEMYAGRALSFGETHRPPSVQEQNIAAKRTKKYSHALKCGVSSRHIHGGRITSAHTPQGRSWQRGGREGGNEIHANITHIYREREKDNRREEWHQRKSRKHSGSEKKSERAKDPTKENY